MPARAPRNVSKPRTSEVDGDPTQKRPRRARGEVDVLYAAGRLTAQPRGEEELCFSPVRAGQVLDADEGFDVPVAIAPGPVEERVAARGLRAELVGPPVGDVTHLEARRESSGQPRGEVRPRRPPGGEGNGEAGVDELG